ncbi:hypothetical protein E2C01_061866 [Portunus trituberculatus]|uniref:Uncharacterized protein n=1 Tax=Portunus trituberculatus TaxID=210409 RepID=A0A5B7HEF2_PORTR|nr:hypothetical protein [Portunus trituberculatus]
MHVVPAQRTMPVEDAAVVAEGVAALEDMEIVEEPRPAPSAKERHQGTAAADQSSPRHAPASSDRKQRRRLLFPAGHGKTTSELFSWFAALLNQHPDLQPLYKEGRNQPYITVSTDSSFYATLVSEGFMGLVLECRGEEGTHPVIIHGVSTHINVNLIEVPAGFHGLKRRMVGQMPRPQLLGVVTGKVPSEVHLLGLGRLCVERYTSEPDLCRHCSRWRHRASAPKGACQPRLVFHQAPPSQTNALVTKPSFLAASSHLSQPSCTTTGTLATPAVFLPFPQRTATVPPVPPKTVPQPGVTQELPATDPTQQLMAVVSELAAKVDNLSATVSVLSNEFAAFTVQEATAHNLQWGLPCGPNPISSEQCSAGPRRE